MEREQAFQRLLTFDRKITLLSHIAAVLEWDQELYAPAAGSDERGRELGFIHQQIHALEAGEETGKLLSLASPGSDDFENAIIRVRARSYHKHRNVPSSLVDALSQATAKAYPVWLSARKAKDWKQFAPAVREIISLEKERAEHCRKPGESLYDAMLDEYEPGAKVAWVDQMLQPLAAVIGAIGQKRKEQPASSFMERTYPVYAQEALHEEIMKAMGFDFSRGLKALSAHPFTSTLGNDDVRITTRYEERGFMDSLYSTIHECGHALYEQWASHGRMKGTSIAGGASYALHESQSRLWENIIARSRPFLSFLFPKVKKQFPLELEGVDFETFYRGVNKVEPSFIRTSSDEVTYVLHILLRYEIEKMLVDGSLQVHEVPEAWNELSRKLLGVTPPDDAMGCLQDVHWASGQIGYFPTYALGNLYGAQIWDALRRDFNPDPFLERGELDSIVHWLGEHVWRHGMLYSPDVLIKKVSGKALDATSFTSYLETKYKELCV